MKLHNLLLSAAQKIIQENYKESCESSRSVITMSNEITWESVFNADSDTLITILNTLEENHYLYPYTQIIYHYLNGNTEKLISSLPLVTEEPQKTAAELRIAIRIREPKQSLLKKAQDLFPSLSNSWQGEFAFIIAKTYEITEDKTEASKWYKASANAFEKSKVFKKSIRAFQNHLAIENQMNPERKFISEFFYVFRKAKTIKEFGVAGISLMNISREYERHGGHKAALKYINRAIPYLEHDAGQSHYYLALVHRCHIFYSLDRIAEAEQDYESAKISPHQEVKAALTAIDQIFRNQKNSEEIKNLTPGWKNRLQNKNQPKLGDQESQFIEYISKSPRDKFEIIEHLYGNIINLEQAENRFKNLLSRVRKKYPSLFIFEDGKYKISEVTPLPKIFWKKTG